MSRHRMDRPGRFPARTAGLLVSFALGALATGAARSQDTSQALPAPGADARVAGASGEIEPPPGAVELCGGHVTGAPAADGSPGPHIVWQAWVSSSTVAEVAHWYHGRLAETAYEPREDGCERWRFPRPGAETLLEICPRKSSGSWSECSGRRSRRTVVLLSTDISGGDGGP